MNKLKVSTGELAFLDEGSGPPLLLIHGLAGDHKAWLPQIAEWKRWFRVIAVDTRGAGASTQKDEPVTVESLAGDFVELMQHLDLQGVHIVGRSLGGCIAQWITLQAPERVASVVMLASSGRLDPLAARCLASMREVLEWTGSWEAHARHSVRNFVSPQFFNERQEEVQKVEALIGSSTRLIACYVHQNRAGIRHDLLDQLHRMTCPVLVLSGALDPLGGPLMTQWMMERLPNARHYEFEGCSHFFLMEQPALFMEKMKEWFASIGALKSA